MPTPPTPDDELLEALRVASEYGPVEAARRLRPRLIINLIDAEK